MAAEAALEDPELDIAPDDTCIAAAVTKVGRGSRLAVASDASQALRNEAVSARAAAAAAADTGRMPAVVAGTAVTLRRAAGVAAARLRLGSVAGLA